jgi:murein DD-endopeptidase MepM/ murein hydrolase activator NlpD
MRRAFLLTMLALISASCNPAQSSLIPLSRFTDSAAAKTAYSANTPAPILAFPTLTPDSPIAVPTPLCDPAINFCLLDGHFFFQRPISAPYQNTADRSYLFGSTENDKHQPHHGIDMPNAGGTPVLAAANGIIVFADSDRKDKVSPWPDFYGNVIIIQHDFGANRRNIYSLYGHLSEIDVVPGQIVQAGEVIGLVGSTGAALGSHLHFEVRVGGNTYDDSRNPALWLIPLEGTGVIAGRVADKDGNLLHLTDMKLQFYPFDTSQPDSDILVETYASEQDPVSSDENLQENFAVGDLAAGRYRITFYANYQSYNRWVEVKPDRLTYVEFIVK